MEIGARPTAIAREASTSEIGATPGPANDVLSGASSANRETFAFSRTSTHPCLRCA